MKKRKVILKIESEEKNEEYSFDLPNKWCMNAIIGSIFAGDARVSDRKRLEIVNHSSEERLVFWALPDLMADLSDKKLDEIYQRFRNSEEVQEALVTYCERKHKNKMLEKLAAEGVSERIRRVAKANIKK